MSQPTKIANISTTARALAKLTDVQEIRKYVSALKAVEQVREAAGAELGEINEHVAKRLWLIYRGGELLREMELNPGGGDRRSDHPSQGASGDCPTLADLGFTYSQSSRWQRIAGLEAGELVAYIEEAKANDDRLTVTGAYRLAKRVVDDTATSEDAGETCSVKDLHGMVASGKTFGTIYADPPWDYDNRATRSAAFYEYKKGESTTSLDWLCDPANMPIEALASEQAHLHLWTTNAFLFDAKRIIEAWGFEYKSCFVWVKPQMGIGNYWRVSHEFLLLGVRGGLTFADRGQKSWAEISRGEHSSKPEAVRAKIELVSPAPRLELFARRMREGWCAWGNEVARDLLTMEAAAL